MAGQAVGRIEVVATINTKGYDDGKKHIEKGNKDLESGAQKTSGNFAKVWSVAGKAVITTLAAVGTGITAIVGKSVKEFSQYEQLVGGAQKIFDEIDYSKIEADAQQAYKTMNISASQYLDAINRVGATFAQTMGDSKGYDTAKKGMQAIADYASGTGKSVDELNDKYQMITRNASVYQSIADQFSGILPQTTKDFLSQAQAAGFLSKKYTELSQVPVDEYQQAVTSMVEKGVADLGLLGNTVMESEKTILGSYNAMRSSWDDLITGMADPDADFGELLNKFTDSAITFGANVLPAIEQALTGVVKLVANLIPMLVRQLPSLLSRLLPVIISAFTNLVTVISQTLPQLIPVLVVGAVDLLMAIVDAFPLIIPPLIQGVVLLFTTLVDELTKQENINTLMDGAFELLYAIIDAIPDIVDALIIALPKIITAIFNTITSQRFRDKMAEAGARLMGALGNSIMNIVKGLPSIIWSVLKGGLNTLMGWVEKALNTPIGIINAAIGAINKLPGVNIGKIPNIAIPRLAEGGVIPQTPGGRLALIGEGGEDEAVMPLSKLDAMLSNGNVSGGGAGDTINNTFNIQGIDSESAWRAFSDKIFEYQNQNRKSNGLRPIGA